jgi:hypothetical protein
MGLRQGMSGMPVTALILYDLLLDGIGSLVA